MNTGDKGRWQAPQSLEKENPLILINILRESNSSAHHDIKESYYFVLSDVGRNSNLKIQLPVPKRKFLTHYCVKWTP